VRSCLVLLADDVTRLIPLQVTNLAAVAPVGFPVPLAIPSLHHLTKTFARIEGQLEKEYGDEESRGGQTAGADSITAAGVGDVDRCPTEHGLAHCCADLSGDSRAMGEGGEK